MRAELSDWLDVDWGTIPQWVAASAAVVALAGYVSSRRDAHRSLAVSVYAMVNGHRYDSAGALDLKAVVVNDGATPIIHVNIGLFEARHRRRLWWRSKRQQDWWSGRRVIGRSYYTIAPHSTGEVVEFEGAYAFPPDSTHIPPLMVEFTDGNGRRWVRWPDGRLSRLRRR